MNSFADVMHNYDSSLYNEKYRSSDRVLHPTEKQKLDSVIPRGGRVLDVGCGSANLYPEYIFTLTHRYLGVDISQGQIDRARALWPCGNFVCRDYLDDGFLENPSLDPFDAILFMYSFFHFPKETMLEVLRKSKCILSKSGKILILMRKEIDDFQSRADWCGTDMVWCHPGVDYVHGLANDLGLQFECEDAEHNDHYVWITLTNS